MPSPNWIHAATKAAKWRNTPCRFLVQEIVPAEINYATTEREALAIVWAVRLLRPYLMGYPCKVNSDHKACEALFRQVSSNRRLTKWRLLLSDYKFDVEHRPGSSHAAADASSRLATDGGDQIKMDLEIPTLLVDFRSTLAVDTATLEPIDMTEMLHEQSLDEKCQVALAKRKMHGYPVVEDQDELFVRKFERADMLLLEQVLVPKTLRKRAMALAHQPQASAYAGYSRMYWDLRLQFVWPGMANDVLIFLNDCPICCQARLKRQKRMRKLQLFPPSCALEQMANDILGPLLKTIRGNMYIFVTADRYSKVTRAYSLKQITDAEVALSFVEV